MNNKTVVTNDDLPDCWIKRPSKSRPDRFYYYNTVTQQSQWTLPVSPSDKRQKPLTDKRSAESPKGKDGKCFKISNSSKQSENRLTYRACCTFLGWDENNFFLVVKKSQAKTPAQDRLQNLAKQLKNSSQAKVRAGNVAEQLKKTSPAKSRTANVVKELKNSTPVQCRLQNYGRKSRTESEPLNVIKRTKVDVDKSKLKDVQNVTTPTNNINRSVETRTPNKPCMNRSNSAVPTDEIPSLFPPKTPGQNRLDRLRHSLNSENANTPSESAQHALTVIQSEFGLASTTLSNVGNHIAHTVIDEDEPMDWEPCDVFEQVENVVYNESKRAYIVPDTNVFLDELSCIRDTIHSGEYDRQWVTMNGVTIFYYIIKQQMGNSTFWCHSLCCKNWIV